VDPFLENQIKFRFYLANQIWVFSFLAFTEVRHLPVNERAKLISIEMVKYGQEYSQNEQFFPMGM